MRRPTACIRAGAREVTIDVTARVLQPGCAAGATASIDAGDATLVPPGTHLGDPAVARLLDDAKVLADANVAVRVFTLGNLRDLSGALNAPVDPNMQGPNDEFEGPGPATFAQSIRAYALRGRAPLGAGTLIFGAGANDNDINLAGTGVSPYDLTHKDKRQDV